MSLALRFAIVLLALAPSQVLADGPSLVVLNKTDNTLEFVDPVTLESEVTLETGVGPHEVAISPDGRTAVVANYGASTPGNTLSVYDTNKRELVRVIDLGEFQRPHGIQYEDATRVLVTVEANQAVIRVDVEKGEVLASMRTGEGATHMLVIAPDRSRVYTANIASGTLSAIDLATGELIANVETGDGAEGIDITPDGKEVWVSNRSADTVSVVATAKLVITHQLPCPKFPIRVKFTPDGEYALVSNPFSGDVTVFHAETHLEVRRISMKIDDAEVKEGFFGGAAAGSPQPIGILVSPDGKRAFIANTGADLVTVVDLEEWKAVDRISTGRQPDGLGWVPAATAR